VNDRTIQEDNLNPPNSSDTVYNIVETIVVSMSDKNRPVPILGVSVSAAAIHNTSEGGPYQINITTNLQVGI
jgi:hypothetical protein